MLAFISDLPPLEQERIMCSINASTRFNVPANILLAVAEKEGGKPFLRVQNENGTYDLGVMQFNTAYLRTLKKYGIDEHHVLVQGCYPYELAAWRIAGHIKNDKGDIYERVSNYHSYTPKYNAIYRHDLIVKAKKWAIWLKKHFEVIVVKNGKIEK